MKNQKLLTAAVTSALLVGIGATSAQAFDISGNIALVSDYRFRGISQTGDDAAASGWPRCVIRVWFLYRHVGFVR